MMSHSVSSLLAGVALTMLVSACAGMTEAGTSDSRERVRLVRSSGR